MLIILLVVIIIAILVALSALLARFVNKPKRITLEGEIEFEKNHGMWRDYEDLPKEEYIVKSYDGYELHSTFVPASSTSEKYVIISHGYSGCRLGSVKYLHLFRELGFNCFMYDNRCHGENKYTACTMGFKESKDLVTVINHVYERFGPDIILGLHGESMGSALTINALQYNLDVDFIVSDCGYNDLEKLLTELIKTSMHLPGFFAKIASMASKVFYGYAFSEVKPIAYLNDNEIPICFIHGQADDFIPCKHAKEMHEANKGYSELHLIPEASHAASVLVDEAAYKAIVQSFINKVL